jgi:biopolymer transport protein TolQ
MTEKFFAIALMGHEVTLWILVALSILSIAFILERFFSLSKVASQSRKSSQQLRELLQGNDLGELENIAKDKNSLEGRALSYGLRHAKENGVGGLEEIFTAYANMERPQLDRYLGFLATVGSNAPFIGLLGTVFGIMDAFRGLATSQGDAAAVMIGISKALVATAIGLFVAIPAVIAYNYFQRQVRTVLGNLDVVKDLCVAYAKSKGKG